MAAARAAGMFILSQLEDNVRIAPQVSARQWACCSLSARSSKRAWRTAPDAASMPPTLRESSAGSLQPVLPAADAAARRHCLLTAATATFRHLSQDLGKPAVEAITAALERTFLDKVIAGLGLVVTLYDILSIGDGYVYHSDGGAHYQ